MSKDMESISEECQELKRAYDTCFNNWFAKEFLNGSKTDKCAPIFKEYQACVKKAAKEKNIEVWEIEEDVLGTSKEKKPREMDSKATKKS